jgi:hypothetical protein
MGLVPSQWYPQLHRQRLFHPLEQSVGITRRQVHPIAAAAIERACLMGHYATVAKVLAMRCDQRLKSHLVLMLNPEIVHIAQF